MDVSAGAPLPPHTHSTSLGIMASTCLQPSSCTDWQLATSPVFPAFPQEDFSCTPEACSALTKGSLEVHEVEPPQGNAQPVRSGSWLVSTPGSCHAAFCVYHKMFSGTEPYLLMVKLVLLTFPYSSPYPVSLRFLASASWICLPNKLTEPKSLLRVRGTQTGHPEGEFLFSLLLLPGVCLPKLTWNFYIVCPPL